jgi:protease IV
VASAADRIYLGPSDQLMLKGLRAELMYFKKTLDKLGVTVDVEHAGKYKDFGDMFTRSDMSPETREVIGSVVDGLYGAWWTTSRRAARRAPTKFAAIIDQGPFTATQAQKAGLVDALKFEDEMWSELKDKLHGRAAPRGAGRLSEGAAEAQWVGGKSRIAMLVAQGDIVRGGAGDNGADESD